MKYQRNNFDPPALHLISLAFYFLLVNTLYRYNIPVEGNDEEEEVLIKHNHHHQFLLMCIKSKSFLHFTLYTST